MPIYLQYKSPIILLQSKLNCEVLYDDLAFEVRWAVAGESIVVQLVAKLGKFLAQNAMRKRLIRS